MREREPRSKLLLIAKVKPADKVSARSAPALFSLLCFDLRLNSLVGGGSNSYW